MVFITKLRKKGNIFKFCTSKTHLHVHTVLIYTTIKTQILMLNLFFVCTGLIGFIISFLMFIGLINGKKTNVYLQIIFFFISTRISLYGLQEFIYSTLLKEKFILYSTFYIITIPFCYLYFKNSLGIFKFKKRELLHFILPFVFLIYRINVINSHEMKQLLLKLFILTFFITYIILSFKKLKKQKTNNEIKTFNWFLFICFLLLSIVVTYSVFDENSNDKYISGFKYQWLSTLIWLVVFFKVLISPSILFGLNKIDQENDQFKIKNLNLKDIWSISGTSNPKNIQHIELKEKIDEKIIDYLEKIEALPIEIFIYTKINLKHIGYKLNIPESHLSYIFKYHCKISFSEYKKIIRIHNAINLIDKNYLINNTLDSLSKEVGYKSYNPFFTSFKKITGMSPLEFNRIKKKKYSI